MSNKAPSLISMLDTSKITPPPDLEEHPDEYANSFCNSFSEALCCPFGGYFPIMKESEYGVQLFCGKYDGTITEPGCYYRNGCCIDIRRVPINLQSYDLPNIKVVDLRGNPIMVSAVVTWKIVEARRAVLDVDNVSNFVAGQAPIVLKSIMSKYPYDSDVPEAETLRKETATVQQLMIDALQEKVLVAGVKVIGFSINELSYAPEIAAAMLKKQQAEAFLDARKAMSAGALVISKDILDNLKDVVATDSDRCRLASNLITILMSDKDVVTNVPLS